MTEDDGTQPFGEIGSTETIIERADWNTPEWRAEMEAKYADVFCSMTTGKITFVRRG